MNDSAAIVARMERWAAFHWTPAVQGPRRDPRLAALFDPCREALVTATDATWAAVGAAVPADWDEAFVEAVRIGEAADRAGDVRAARFLNPYEEYDEYGRVRGDPARRAAYAIFMVVVVRDLLPAELLDRLTGPWRAGFGTLPA